MAQTRPNILFISTDEHRYDCLGCYGNPVIRTPHIDSIAEGGVRFERGYVQNPMCMPSRMSIMTGRYCSEHGCNINCVGIPAHEQRNTFMQHLAHAGYYTAAIGKMHMMPKYGPFGLHYLDLVEGKADRNNQYTDYLRARGWEGRQHEAKGERLPFGTFTNALPAEETIDVSGLDEALSAGTFVASYGIPAGACLTGAKESTINLLPPEVRQRRRNMAGVASIGAVVVGFWLFIFATMSMLEKSASGYRELLDLRQDQWEEALERTDKIKALEAKRTKLKSKRFVLENLVDVHPMWMGMFRELSLVVPEEVLLTSLKVGRQGPVYEWEMTGTVEAPNHRELKRGFNRFYTSLISSRFFYGLRMEPVKITSDDDGTGSETTQSRMEFHLKGLMRQAVTREDQG